MNELEQFGNIPVDSTVLYGLIDRYKFKRNKVASMEKRGDIVRLKKGLYVVSDKISRKPLSRELIANHLYGPSYVSFETALAFYGLIPEKVFACVRQLSSGQSGWKKLLKILNTKLSRQIISALDFGRRLLKTIMLS
jgi:predicted transcriptional regulator of viral defense system